MIVDFHTHYPMHVQPDGARSAYEPMTSRRWRARHRARVLRIASQLANYDAPGGGPGVTMDLMRRGEIGVALSAIYSPFAEIDLAKPYGAPPEDSYFADAIDLIELVEQDVATHDSEVARVAKSPAQLGEALSDRKLALVHCIEGGFHLGASEETVRANVAELARRGVAYIKLAHLFWRRVATNSVAVPLPEWLYALVFPQPPYEGLSELGVAAVETMLEHGVLVDVAHMSEASLRDTFEIVDDRAPVIASHGACRFGERGYNLSFETIARIGQSGGVIGITSSERHLTDGLRRGRRRPSSSRWRRSARMSSASGTSPAPSTTSRSAPTSTGSSSRWSAAWSTPAGCRPCRRRCAPSTARRSPRRSAAATC